MTEAERETLEERTAQGLEPKITNQRALLAIACLVLEQRPEKGAA
jgi:hypothetical protein